MDAPIVNILNFLFSISVWSWAKLLFLVGIGVYILFASLVIKQVELMRRTVSGGVNILLLGLAWIHLGVAVLVFLLALVIL